MRKGLIAALIASVGMLFSVAACNGGGGSSTKYEVTINNKTEMQAAWAGDAEARSLNLTIKKDGKEQNALEAIQDGDLKVTSSNTTVATIQGVKVSPVDGEGGKSTISVVYGNVSDNVEVTVTKANKHGKIASDPFTVAEAIAKCKETGTTSTTTTYYVRGIVTSIGTAYDESYGNITVLIGDTKTATATVTAYRVTLDTGVDHTIIGPGSEVLISGTLVNYNGTTPEINQGGKIHSATQGDVARTITATVAEALAAAQALAANTSSLDTYVITGYVVNVVSGSEFYMSDTKGELPKSQELFEVYGWKGDNARLITVDAKITVTATLKHYVSTSQQGVYAYETNTPTNVEILEAGREPEIEATGPTALTALEAGTKYYVGALQKNINKMLFLDGKLDNNYLTSGKFAGAAEFEVAAVTGGYNLKTGTKFVNLNSSQKLVLEDTAKTVWVWDTNANSLKANSNNKDYFIAAYNAFSTFGSSESSYILDGNNKVKAGQFPLQFYAKEELADPTEVQLDMKADGFVYVNFELAVRANPYNADLSKLTWKSSDDTVATVANGVVTPLKVGKTTITAQFGNDESTVKDTCELTVTALDFGTTEDPLSISEAKTLIDMFKDGKNITPAKITVEGIVSIHEGKLSKTDKANLYLASEDGTADKAFELYAVLLPTESTDSYEAGTLVGKKVVATGYATYYANGNLYEFSNKNPSGTTENGIVLSMVDGGVVPTSIVLSASDFKLEQGANRAVSHSFRPYGAVGEVEYAISPADKGVSYSAGKVVATEEAELGEYTLTVSYSADVKKEIKVTVIAPRATAKLALSNIGAGISTTAVTENTETTVSENVLIYNNGKKQGNAIFLTKNTGYICNKTAMPGGIKSIKVTTNSGAAAGALYGVAFSATALTAKTTAANEYKIGANASYEYACDVDDATFFCIYVTNAANGQVLNLEITYFTAE